MSKKKNVKNKKKKTPSKSTNTSPKKAKPKEELHIESTEIIEEDGVTIVKKETIDIIETDDEIEEELDDELEEDQEEIAEAQELLNAASEEFQKGNYPEAREQLVALVESDANHEIREQAFGMLSRMEMDVRTLMVGAVGMVMLLLIPTIGFQRALWMIPVLFLILLIDPNLFKAPEQND